MSGGAYEYAYNHVQTMANTMRVENTGCAAYTSTALRRAFREHLFKVARAMRAIEWNDSEDGDDKEQEYILACVSPTELLDIARKYALMAKQDLEHAIELVDKEKARDVLLRRLP